MNFTSPIFQIFQICIVKPKSAAYLILNHTTIFNFWGFFLFSSNANRSVSFVSVLEQAH